MGHESRGLDDTSVRTLMSARAEPKKRRIEGLDGVLKPKTTKKKKGGDSEDPGSPEVAHQEEDVAASQQQEDVDPRTMSLEDQINHEYTELEAQSVDAGNDNAPDAVSYPNYVGQAKSMNNAA